MANTIAKFFGYHLESVPNRLRDIASWYLLILMLPNGKRTLALAAERSQKSKSCYSAFLKKSKVQAHAELETLVRKTAKNIPRKPIVSRTPWTVAILIDSTLHKRSTLKVENAQKHNHGSGWVVGHMWTNIILLIGNKKIPLPPIPFYTKAYCKKRGITYVTANTKVSEWLNTFDLASFIGSIDSNEVVVLLDSGYDDRKIQKTITNRGWDFVASIKKRDLFRTNENSDGHSLTAVFAHAGFWKTIYCFTAKWKKRKDFRVCVRQGWLSRLSRKLSVVCSEPRRDRQTRKFIACSNISVDAGAIVRTYQRRWDIELFHKDVKSRLGMEDVSTHSFESVHAHVLWVYVAYILLQQNSQGELSVFAEQKKMEAKFESSKFSEVARLADRYGSSRLVKAHCLAVIQRLEAA